MGNRFLHTVIPWDKEIENILNRLAKDRVSYSRNPKLASEFGKRHSILIKNEFIDVVTTNYRKKQQKTIFVLNPNASIEQKNKIFHFHKIF